MATPVRDLTQDWRKGDAERLARFFNETGRGWPGGAWDPKTPEESERRHKESRYLGVFVAEVGDEMVAYCSLYAKPNERNRAYVGLLTAHPDYHGKGYGKAVLLGAVERVYEMGIPRVDLHTWAGNLKAVPLYKKSGFMWSPESGSWGVYMQNFTPGARQRPVAHPYFRSHDWYRTMKRDLSLTEDEHKRGKVRVYSYQWEEDGDRLRMVYDRQSWGLVEVETNDFLVGGFLEDEKLVAGLPQRIRWRIVNYRQQPLEVALIARGDEGIRLDHKEVIRVKKRFQAEAQFEISPEIEEKEQEPRSPIIHTDLLVNGMPIALAHGFEAQQALSFGIDADGIGLRPNRAERVVVQVYNEMDRPARAKLRISASAGAKLGQSAAQVRVPAKGSAEVPVTLEAAASGPVVLHVEAEAVTGKTTTRPAGRPTVRPKAEDLYAHVLSPGDLVGHVEKKRVVLESAALQLAIYRQGGWARVVDKVRNRWEIAGIGSPRLGPPFGWEDFFDTKCEARVEREDGRISAVLRTQSILRPGVWLERRITVSNLPIIQITDTLINGTGGRLSGQLRFGASVRGGGGWTASPTAKGIVREKHESLGRSLGEHSLSDKGEDWPEGWYASEDGDGIATGLVWDQASRVEVHGGWLEVEREFAPAGPGQSSTLAPAYVFVGDGDHTTVRRWWQQLFGPRVDREQRPPKTRQAFEFGLRPRVLVLHDGRREAELVVDSLGRLEFEGSLRVSAPEEIRVQPSHTRFDGVCGNRGHSQPVVVKRLAGMKEGAYLINTTALIDRAAYHDRQPVVVLGEARKKVSVTRAGEKGELLRVDNGALVLTVAPGFNGSAISLQRNGEELLRSAYPEARPLAYENPWFGGICPHLSSLGRELSKEKFKAQEVERGGSQGVVWRGVRVSCLPKQERGRQEALSLDYLLAPGSSIIAVVARTTRRTGTAGWLEGGFTLWPVLGGSHLEAVLTTSGDDRTSRMRTEFGSWLGAEKWIIAENPKAGQALRATGGQAVAVAACDQQSHVRGVVFGSDGYFLAANRGGTQEAKETRESVFFVAFTGADQAGALAQALSELDALP